jgi:hypothetical protein
MCWSWFYLSWLDFGLVGVGCFSEGSDERCPIHDGGSLAGNDSHDASSTSSQGPGCDFCAVFALTVFREGVRSGDFFDAISLRLPRLVSDKTRRAAE